MAAVCGTSASITGSGTTEAHSFSIAWNKTENDVRVFGSGSFGDWLGCASNGQLTVNSYDIPEDPGTALTFSCVLGDGHTASGTSIMTNWSVNVDAKGLVEYVSNSRVTALTIA